MPQNYEITKECKYDMSPNFYFCVLPYGTGTENNTVVDAAPSYSLTNHNGPTYGGALFIQWQLHPTPGNKEDLPEPNNVAEELSSKLPAQIGCVAPTQLGLKYGNCISH